MRDDVRAVLDSSPLVHLTTIDPDGRPQVSLVWAEADGDEIVMAHLAERRKVKNIRRDDRVALSMVTGGSDGTRDHYLVIHGRATVTEGGAPDVLRRLAKQYVGPDTVFPPGDNPPAGYVTRVTIERVTGIGPWMDD